MHTPQVYLVFCATIPNPARLHFVLEKMVTRSDEEPLYKVQGDMLSAVTESMFRTWFAVLLVRGEEMTDKQWWQNYDSQIRSVFHCVKKERQDVEYVNDLNAAVVALLDVYDTAPATAVDANAGAGAGAGDGEDSDETND